MSDDVNFQIKYYTGLKLSDLVLAQHIRLTSLFLKLLLASRIELRVNIAPVSSDPLYVGSSMKHCCCCCCCCWDLSHCPCEAGYELSHSVSDDQTVLISHVMAHQDGLSSDQQVRPRP